MALLFIDGFDAADFTLGKYNAFNATGLSTTTATRYGTGSALAAASTGLAVRKDFSPVAKAIAGFAVRVPTVLSDTTSAVNFFGDAGTQFHVGVRLMVGGAVAAYRSSTQIAVSAPGVVLPNTWHYLEAAVTLSDTVGTVTVRVDGAQVLTFTGDTKNGGTNSTVDAVSLAPPTTSGAGTLFDDVYIADATGPAPNNDFLGEVRVQTLRPNGPGNQTQLTPVGSATNWQNVDETPPSNADYNWSGTTGQRDLYTLDDLAVGTTTVYGCQLVSYAQKTDAATRSVVNVIRAGGANYNSPPRALTTAPTPTLTIANVNPATAAAWTLTDVNALETGVEVA